MRKYVMVVLFAFLTLALPVSAQGSAEKAKAEEKITLHVLYNDTDSGVEEQMKWVMQQMQKQYPQYDIQLDMSPGDAQTYETKVRTLIAAGGEDLDIWWERGGSWASPLLTAKSALPLDQYLDKDAYWATLIPSARKTNGDGHFYALPFESISYEIMCYNKSIFKQCGLDVPKTVDELKHAVDVLAKTDYIPISVGAKDGWCAAMMFEGFAYSVDPQITSKIVKGDAKFSDTPYAEATQVMRDLLQRGAFSKNVALTGIDEALPLFESGKAAMMANGSWEVAPGSMKMGDDFGYFYYPVIRDGDVQKYGQNCAGGLKENSGYMVYSGTKHPKEAAEVALALAQMSSRWLYEISGDPMVPFLPEKLGWKNEKGFAPAVAQLAKDQQNFQFVYGLVQDVMPTAAASSGVMEYTSKFMASAPSYTNEAYLSDMDKAAREE